MGTHERKEQPMNAELYMEMIADHKNEQPENSKGMYRLRCYTYWPIRDEDGPEPDDKFYDNLERGLLDYMSQVAQQVAEDKLMEYVEMSIYNEHTGFYETMFASHQLHTIVSYGLNPNEYVD